MTSRWGSACASYGLWLLSLFACDVLAHLNLPKESLLDGWFWQWMSKPVVTLAISLERAHHVDANPLDVV